MTKDCEWIEYFNTAKWNRGFLSMNVFQKETERTQTGIDILKEYRRDMPHSTLRPSAFVACDYACVTCEEIKDKFNLSSAQDFGGALGRWADNKNHTLKYRKKAIDNLIELCEEKLKTASDRLRVQLIYDEGSYFDIPSFSYFIFGSNGGYHTDGLGEENTLNIFHRISKNKFQIVAGKNSAIIKIKKNKILYSEETPEDPIKAKFRLGPSPY